MAWGDTQWRIGLRKKWAHRAGTSRSRPFSFSSLPWTDMRTWRKLIGVLPTLGILFLLSMLSIVMNGYYYGDFQQGILLVFQKTYIDDELYQNDIMLGLKPHFYTY